MEIKYLLHYEKNKQNLKKAEVKQPEPCTLEEIEFLEKELNNHFALPASFKEYLSIGGKYSALPLDVIYDSMKNTTDYVKYKLHSRGIYFDRPIVVFDHLDNLCFTFIYLDEGNAPKPFNCSLDPNYDSDEGKIVWETPHETFSKMIEKYVALGIAGMGA